MAKVKASDIVKAGIDLLEQIENEKVPYVNNGSTLKGMDCQGLVEYLLRQCGLNVNYRGSNDMWRNALSWQGTVEEAVEKGYLVPGAWLFIWEEDGAPSTQDGDNKGNASHVGQQLKSTTAVHASSSRGQVAESYIGKKSINGGWNRVGLCKHIDYSEYIGTPLDENMGQITQEEGETMTATVISPNNAGVKLRSTPGTNKPYVTILDPGTRVNVLEKGDEWSAVEWESKKRYIMTEFLSFEEEADITKSELTDIEKDTIREAIKLLEGLL